MKNFRRLSGFQLASTNLLFPFFICKNNNVEDETRNHNLNEKYLIKYTLQNHQLLLLKNVIKRKKINKNLQFSGLLIFY